MFLATPASPHHQLVFLSVNLCSVHTTRQYVMLVPLCWSAAGPLRRAFSDWALCFVGGQAVRWHRWVCNLSDRLATAIPSPVPHLRVCPLEQPVTG